MGIWVRDLSYACVDRLAAGCSRCSEVWRNNLSEAGPADLVFATDVEFLIFLLSISVRSPGIFLHLGIHELCKMGVLFLIEQSLNRLVFFTAIK